MTLAWNQRPCVCGHVWSAHNAANLGCAYCACGRGPGIDAMFASTTTPTVSPIVSPLADKVSAKLTTEQVEERYVGRLVMVERVNPTNEHSAYQDGQYLVVTATPSQLMGINVTGNGVSSHGGLGVYGLGCGFRGLPLVGRAAYRVIGVDDPGEWVDRQLNLAEAEIADVREGRKKATWIISVYNKAEAAIPLARKAIRAARQHDRVAAAAETHAKTTEDTPAAVQITQPDTEALLAASSLLFKLFDSYVRAGFTRAEAMQLVINAVATHTANATPTDTKK